MSIGSAGKTVDGREIPENWLTEIVETYDASKYAAVINLNHWRPTWGNTFGKVLAVKLGEKNGSPIILANIEPNERLVALQKEEVLFSSMEVHENFQGSGKAYLTGMAVTPIPASVNTEQFKFSAFCGAPKSEEHVHTEFTPIEFTFSGQADDSEDSRFFSKLKRMLLSSEREFAASDEHLPPTDAKDKSMSISTEAAEKLTVALTALTTRLETFSNQPPEQEKEKTLEEKYSELEAEYNSLKAEFSALKENQPEKDKPKGDDEQTNAFAAIQSQITQLSAQLAKAAGEQPGTDVGEQFSAKDKATELV